MFRIPVVLGIDELPDGLPVYTAMPRAERTLDQTDFSKPCIIVIGGEGRGVRPDLTAKARAFRIPTNRVESLNVAASAAILLSRSYALRPRGGQAPSPVQSRHGARLS